MDIRFPPRSDSGARCVAVVPVLSGDICETFGVSVRFTGYRKKIEVFALVFQNADQHGVSAFYSLSPTSLPASARPTGVATERAQIDTGHHVP
jgi:hypothetical protein